MSMLDQFMAGVGRCNRIDTALRPMWSKKATTSRPLWVPLTGAINTTLVKQIRQARWLEAATPKFLCRLGYQMSSDGVSWSATVTGVGSFSGTAGWVFNDSTAVSVTTDQQLF